MAAKNAVAQPTMATTTMAVSRVHEKHMRAGNDVNARGDHRRRVDQSADGRGAFHRIRQPDIERKLRGFAGGAHKEQQTGNRQRSELSPGSCIQDGLVAASKTILKSSVPNVRKSRNIPSMKPKSPMRLTMNAFLPASEADFFRK